MESQSSVHPQTQRPRCQVTANQVDTGKWRVEKGKCKVCDDDLVPPVHMRRCQPKCSALTVRLTL
eukprot:293492-Amphidinium_carterae.1